MWVPIAQVTREFSDPISVVSGVVDFTYPYGCPVRSHGSREEVTIVSITYSVQRQIPPLHKSWARVPTKMELRDKLNRAVCSGYRRYFQHAHFVPIVGVGKRGAY